MIKPLTPQLRKEILECFDNQIRELNMCEKNNFILVRLRALEAYKKLFSTLPDGYPIPFENG